MCKEPVACLDVTARHGEPQSGLSSTTRTFVGTHDRGFYALLGELCCNSLEFAVGSAHDNDGLVFFTHNTTASVATPLPRL